MSEMNLHSVPSYRKLLNFERLRRVIPEWMFKTTSPARVEVQFRPKLGHAPDFIEITVPLELERSFSTSTREKRPDTYEFELFSVFGDSAHAKIANGSISSHTEVYSFRKVGV